MLMDEADKERSAQGLRLASWAGELCASAAIIVLGIALAANLAEAAGMLGKLAATLAIYGLLLPALAHRLYEFVPKDAGDPQATALTLFLVGAGLAVGQALEPSGLASAITTTLYLAAGVAAGRLYVLAWLENASLLPIWSLLRISVALLSVSALAAAAEAAGHMAGLFRVPWLASAIADGALLAVAFHATAAAAADWQPDHGLARLPARWPEMVALTHAGAAATAAVQAWLTRYPGGGATALLVVTVAPVVLASGLLLSDALRLRAAGAVDWPARAGAATLLLVADLAFLAGAALSNLRAAGATLLGRDPALWPWLWRLILAATAAAACKGLWEKPLGRSGLSAGLATAAGIAVILLAGYLWLTDAPLAGPGFIIAGTLLMAGGLVQVARRPTP